MADPQINPEWEVSVNDVKNMIENDEDFVFIDCRTPGEYEVARIEGAKLVPLGDVAARLPELEEYADEKVIIHCHHGGRSLQMAAILRQQGFDDVKSMAGGIEKWSLEIDPTVPRY